MKNKLKLLNFILAEAAVIMFSCNAVAETASPLIKEPPHNIYHVIKNKTLQETANQLANRSGITFKINPAIDGDVINRKLAGDDWNAVLIQLLQGYNYTTVSDKGRLKTVVITGRNGSGQDNVAMPAMEGELVVVAPDFSKKIPAKYNSFNPGSVLSVKLPMAKLANIPVGDELTLDLPIGQYKVQHDNLVDHGDGSSTWIGYLNEEGKGYRVYISQGDAGIIGNIYTPDGAYNIESANGQTVIVDIDKSGLLTAGYEHDEADPIANDLMMDAGITIGGQLSNLKAAAESARTAANALALEANVLNDKYLKAQDTASAAENLVAELNLALSTAKINFAAASAELGKSFTIATVITNYINTSAELGTISLELSNAISAKYLAASNVTALKRAYDTKAVEVNRAESNAKTAEAAYAAAMADPNGATGSADSTNTGTGPIVDLMVLYTTVNQTADYAKQRIKYLVDVSNQAYKDSGINMSLRLVHTRHTDYVEDNGNTQALIDLANDTGAFSGIAALRNQYGADLVMLFRPLYAQTAGNCGTSYIGFANGGSANSALAYGTIGDGYSKDSLSKYYCGTNAFAHEIGHSLGNVHDREYSDAEGKFPYSYAWGINGQFGTIMSYYGPSVMLFSSPELATQCAGTPCGFAEGDRNASDQVKTTNYTAPLVAGYRWPTVSVPVIQ